jgi:hypothetical protein
LREAQSDPLAKEVREMIEKEIKIEGINAPLVLLMNQFSDHVTFKYSSPAYTLRDGEFEQLDRTVWSTLATYSPENGWNLLPKFKNEIGVAICSFIRHEFLAELEAWNMEWLIGRKIPGSTISDEQLKLLNVIIEPTLTD